MEISKSQTTNNTNKQPYKKVLYSLMSPMHDQENIKAIESIYLDAIEQGEWVLALNCLKQIGEKERFNPFFEILLENGIYGLALNCAIIGELSKEHFEKLHFIFLKINRKDLAEICCIKGNISVQ